MSTGSAWNLGRMLMMWISFAHGSVRLVSYLKLEARTDKVPTLAGKKIRL